MSHQQRYVVMSFLASGANRAPEIHGAGAMGAFPAMKKLTNSVIESRMPPREEKVGLRRNSYSWEGRKPSPSGAELGLDERTACMTSSVETFVNGGRASVLPPFTGGVWCSVRVLVASELDTSCVAGSTPSKLSACVAFL